MLIKRLLSLDPSELPVQFLRLLLPGFEGTLGAEQVVHRVHYPLHFPGQVQVALLQLVLLLPQVGRRVQELAGLVAAVAPQLLHVRQQHLHALHELLETVGRHLEARRVRAPVHRVVRRAGLEVCLWLHFPRRSCSQTHDARDFAEADLWKQRGIIRVPF